MAAKKAARTARINAKAERLRAEQPAEDAATVATENTPVETTK